MNSFHGSNGTSSSNAFSNNSIHDLCGRVINLRKQLVPLAEVVDIGGWDDALNSLMRNELENLRTAVARHSYNLTGETKEQIIEKAKDVNVTLEKTWTDKSLDFDQVVSSPTPKKTLPYRLDGTDPDIPQIADSEADATDNGKTVVRNDALRRFIIRLDELFVDLTRLAVRFQSRGLDSYSVARVQNALQELYAFTVHDGGHINRNDVPVGTLPSEDGKSYYGGTDAVNVREESASQSS